VLGWNKTLSGSRRDRGTDSYTFVSARRRKPASEHHRRQGRTACQNVVPPRTAFAIRYHAALRFYPDAQAGYCYPNEYREMFGIDYVPPPHIEASYQFARSHRWYGAARAVTVNDLYSFDPKAVVKIDPFVEIIARHFKQPAEGLGNDNSASAHMWRTLANPDLPL
jgi:hypothetical protein